MLRIYFLIATARPKSKEVIRNLPSYDETINAVPFQSCDGNFQLSGNNGEPLKFVNPLANSQSVDDDQCF